MGNGREDDERRPRARGLAAVTPLGAVVGPIHDHASCLPAQPLDIVLETTEYALFYPEWLRDRPDEATATTRFSGRGGANSCPGIDPGEDERTR